mmetsp:Transcript_24641/g.62824  ORF Transcript_24641/g.62824 Transcript_24641/m.62824 type:complete len:213 (-) Transcript_24641:2904-3542(-)
MRVWRVSTPPIGLYGGAWISVTQAPRSSTRRRKLASTAGWSGSTEYKYPFVSFAKVSHNFLQSGSSHLLHDVSNAACIPRAVSSSCSTTEIGTSQGKAVLATTGPTAPDSSINASRRRRKRASVTAGKSRFKSPTTDLISNTKPLRRFPRASCTWLQAACATCDHVSRSVVERPGAACAARWRSPKALRASAWVLFSSGVRVDSVAVSLSIC